MIVAISSNTYAPTGPLARKPVGARGSERRDELHGSQHPEA